ncbi:disease resistance protein RGA2-like [Pyrus ussuriensis x Pyrus communis]|uniref:Disease resistance protein RGA2-like n=1 Tax=Pyrus ussuriensis x Pyrus communis TaxID=2448454 RepID=A0A5N5G484_9ROSA|nr:disease resistance protein RGA2-like [Pyrus ussuriensis x Pyrus communis]
MAELAFSLAAKLIERLSSIASEEICLAWGVQADLQKLGRTMSTIRDVLLDAEEKQARNSGLRIWLRQLKDVFLDAEDLLDEFECEALRRQVRRFFSRSNPVAFDLRVGHGIKDIRARLQELKEDKNFDDLQPCHHHAHLGDHLRENRNTTHSFVRASEVIGRDTEKNTIVDLLMQQGDDHQGGVNGNVSSEDVGELYFKELWDRSFFQNVKDCAFFYQFDMHDLIHDLVQSVAQGESLTVDSAGTKGVSENVRHLTFLEDGQNVSTTLQKLNKVRTLSVHSCENIDQSFLSTCISRFKYLRCLGLVNASWELLPSSIGSLKHLRSLILAGNEKITALPNSICKLQSLQTLVLSGCVNLEELPRDMRKLISLRSLVITTKQSSFPENGVGCLTSLRFLVIMECSNLTCLPRDMSYLTSLRTLVIAICEQLDLVMENYQVISLRLQKLWIKGVPRMVALPEWFQGAANTLQVLVIEDCENLEALPGWLTSFKSLRRLKLKSCPKLLSLPDEMHRLTALTEVRIADCPDLERRCQHDTGEDWPKISHVPNVSFEGL